MFVESRMLIKKVIKSSLHFRLHLIINYTESTKNCGTEICNKPFLCKDIELENCRMVSHARIKIVPLITNLLWFLLLQHM